MATHTISPPDPGTVDASSWAAGDTVVFETTSAYTGVVKIENLDVPNIIPVRAITDGGQAIFVGNAANAFTINNNTANFGGGLWFDGSFTQNFVYPFFFQGKVIARDVEKLYFNYCKFEPSHGAGIIGLSIKGEAGSTTPNNTIAVVDSVFRGWSEAIYWGDTDASLPVNQETMVGCHVAYSLFEDNYEAVQFSRMASGAYILYNIINRHTPEAQQDTAYSTAIQINRCDDLRIIGNMIDDCDGDGITINGDLNNNSQTDILYNLLHNVGNGPLTGKNRGIVVFSNTGIPVFIRHNSIITVKQSVSEGVGIKDSGQNSTIEHNLLSDIGALAIDSTSGLVSDNYTGDNTIATVEFVDPAGGDFRLRWNSPAKDNTIPDGYYGSEGSASNVTVNNSQGSKLFQNVFTVSRVAQRGPRPKNAPVTDVSELLIQA
jgi:hypothetical protein